MKDPHYSEVGLGKFSFVALTKPLPHGSSHPPLSGRAQSFQCSTNTSLCNRPGNWFPEASQCEKGCWGREPRSGESQPVLTNTLFPHFPPAKLGPLYRNYLTYLKSAEESSPIRRKEKSRKQENRKINNHSEWQERYKEPTLEIYPML